MKTKIFFLVSVLAILGAGLFALYSNGSDIVNSGKLETLRGKLSYDGSEWSLETTAKKLYDLHLGNYSVLYPEGLDLKEGQEAEVEGFVLNSDIAVTSITSGGSTFTLRDSETGRPLWAGQGRNTNRNAQDTCTGDMTGRNLDGSRGRFQMPSSSNRQGRGRI